MGLSAAGPRAGATLEALVSVRSQEALAVMAFYDAVAEGLDYTPWHWPDGAAIRASEVAVEPMVLTKTMRLPRPTERERPDEWVRRELALSPLEEIDAARYELPARLEGREERRWGQVVRQGRAVVAVKGAPGSGKTFITRHTVAEFARQAKARLQVSDVTTRESPAVVWVTATALAEASAAAPDEAVVEAFANSLTLRLSARARRWLLGVLPSPRTLIVIDALHELRKEEVAPFRERAAWIARLPGRRIVTCRTLQWEERRDDLVGWPCVTEVELAPLGRRQQRSIVQKMFVGDSALAQRLNTLLQANVALRHACTTPLRLMFACLLHRERVLEDHTTYAELYANLVRQLVIGKWRTLKRWARDEVEIDSVLLALDEIGWGLFQDAPESNRFTLSQWRQAATTAAIPLSPDVFLGDMQGLGFVVLAGVDDRGYQCWSFAHRTILEFLAARALSCRPQREWLAAWFDDGLPHADAAAFQRHHAWIVLHAKARCRARPRCGAACCPVCARTPRLEVEGSSSQRGASTIRPSAPAAVVRRSS